MGTSILICWLATAQAAVGEVEAQATTDSRFDARGNKQHRVTVTASLSRAFFYTAELSGEVRLGNKLGLSVIAGAGAPSRLLALELGAQLRYYLLGSFIHGLELGFGVLGSGLFGRGAPGFELGAAPFVGYKLATNLGLTFEAQLGPSVSMVTAGGEVIPRVGALINLNVGWSF